MNYYSSKNDDFNLKKQTFLRIKLDLNLFYQTLNKVHSV